MSIRLIRQSSDTPNITNRDDTRMTRFAYGGIDGVVQGFGSELSYAVSGSKFVLNSGCIVLQGWEVDVEGTGWELDLSTVVGTQYHLVYLEVSVGVESAVIKSTYLTGSTPSIDFGDDLTKYPEGTARLPLYSFVIENGTIHSVVKKFSTLSYYGEKLNSLYAWQSDVLKKHIIQISNIGTSSEVDYGAKNVSLIPGKIYVFNCVFLNNKSSGNLTMVMYYSESGTISYSTTAHDKFGEYDTAYAMRLAYNGTEKILRLEGWMIELTTGWFGGSHGYGATLYYREL